MNHRKILSQTALVIGVILFSAGLQTFAVFTPPTAPPPQADAYAPLNTGPDAQAKIGGLLLNLGGAQNGLIVQQGNVGIGVANPIKKLEVAGEIVSTGNITSSGDICVTGNGGACLTRLVQNLTQSSGLIVYTQAAGCSGGGGVTTNSSCSTASWSVDEWQWGQPTHVYGIDCAGNTFFAGYYWEGANGSRSCLNNAVGALVASSATNNTITIYHPTRTESISCGMNVAGMPITLTAAYDLNTNRYAVSGPWINTTLSMGGSAQGCYSGGCGEAQTNLSIGDSVSTTYTRNASGGITTTIIHQGILSGSFWLSNGRGSGSCSAGFSS